MVTQLTYYSLNYSKSTVLNEFLNADREVKLIRSAGRLFHKFTTRSEKTGSNYGGKGL